LDDLSHRCTKDLEELNSDFKNAQKEYSGKLKLDVLIYGYRQGPFAGLKNRIKNCYLNRV
jgi:hypothetical protein